MIQDNKILLNTDPKTIRDLQLLAKRLNTNINGVISQALALFMVAQGRKVLFQRNEEELETHKFRDQEPAVLTGGK